MCNVAARRPKHRDIQYNVRDVTVRGWLQLPEGPGPHPVVILAHGFGGVKEWTIPELADTLVGVGIAAIAFDYRNFGDSDGCPREEVDHCGQIDDFLCAIAYASTVPELDPARIGLWGTSLGGRNVLAAAAIDSSPGATWSRTAKRRSVTGASEFRCNPSHRQSWTTSLT